MRKLLEKKVALLLVLVLFISCTPVLEKGSWEPDTYDALTALLKDKSCKGGYAVFDCDNTSIIHDITHSLMLYMVENLRFADAPEHCFTDGLGDTSIPLAGGSLTAAEMGAAVRDKYLAVKALADGGMPLDSLRQTAAFSDWRSSFFAFYDAVCATYDYGTLCLWEPSLATGYSPEELQEVGRASLEYSLGFGKVWEEEWVTADSLTRGWIDPGLVVLDETRNLYRALEKAGITPYVCSASVEWLVELFVCDPEIGFGISPEQVFGLRFVTDENGTFAYDTSYPQPFKEGKVACIDSLIAPLHGGKQPLLVAGDSSGDLAMLTSYPEMRVGLIMNQYRGGKIEELANRHDGRYYSQPVEIPKVPLQ